jgi:hypothetical protein
MTEHDRNLPSAVCPTCGGRLNNQCGGRGEILFGMLAAASIVCALWMVLVACMLPVGISDRVWASSRREVTESPVPTLHDRLRDYVASVSARSALSVRDATLYAGLPLLATNLRWALFALRLLPRNTAASMGTSTRNGV